MIEFPLAATDTIVARLVPKSTPVTSVKPLPVIVTNASPPAGPTAGLKADAPGDGFTGETTGAAT